MVLVPLGAFPLGRRSHHRAPVRSWKRLLRPLERVVGGGVVVDALVASFASGLGSAGSSSPESSSSLPAYSSSALPPCSAFTDSCSGYSTLRESRYSAFGGAELFRNRPPIRPSAS